MIILAGDIGGTNTRLQISEHGGNGIANVHKKTSYKNSDYSSFDAVIDNFLTGVVLKIDRVCFGIAGPVIDGVVDLTNSSWKIEAYNLQQRLGVDRVSLINDFVAIGHGLEVLDAKDLLTLQAGEPDKNGVKAYIGAGTGLGVGFITNCGESYEVHSTEGGHIGFAPRDDLQDELLKFLRKKYQRVSVERVLSGQGLVDIYDFVCAHENIAEAEKHKFDVASLVTEHAIKHQDPLAKLALDIFIDVYGAVVGNLALSVLPFGGLYVVGGIAPKILPYIKEGGFLKAFDDKGRMAGLVKKVPLHVVLCPDVGLRGAMLYAKNSY